MENHTTVAEFILVGFGGHPELQVFLSVFFLVLYTVTLVGNVGMITIISADSRLHTPMYFFLKNLSFLDLCYSSVTAPNALLCFLMGHRAISYNGCAAQMFFFSLFGTTEAFFLAVMAYDRFVAICNPLRYPITMSKRTCAFLVAGSYLSGCLNCSIQTGFTFTLSFCRPGKIDHFFCDVPAVMQASCSDTFANEMVMLAVCGFIIVSTGLVVLISYGYIITTVTRIPSAEGRRRAFSTCTSHLVVVSLFFGTVFFMYAQPGAIISPDQSKVVSVFYTIVIPMLNPLIYSLRNKEVNVALRRQLKKKGFLH
ncbi:olfactory receptor 12-like [Gopherus evgoodei]|uniref:olfactory receptor 12-like n=1 Tax=Gopherus evgoodei TaxID=1825980 RepID=UPI0011CFF7E4|nr:olfactory receptor 12-like [Gopherus evgoodei]